MTSSITFPEVFSSPSSNSPFLTSQSNHDVFLSFRGEDTRYGFTGHLYHALIQKGINTYKDDKELEKGEKISPALSKAIEESKVSIIIFSEDYASSTWCLDELLKILECKESKQQKVLAVYYKVEPSTVRHQKNSFEKAFAEHEEKFDDAKVQRWKTALNQTAGLCGFPLKINEDEYEFIQKIVQEVSTTLPNHFDLHVAKFPVGIKSRVEDINMLLCIEKNDIRMIGIFGVGGIGKTTIAKEMYNRIINQFEESFNQFEESCFLANVRESSKQDQGGLVKLQQTILSDILKDSSLKVSNVDQGINLIMKRLCHKRILLVLDDVDCLDQLEKLCGRCDWFGSGSRIIITTRDEGLLTKHHVHFKYRMKEMDHHEAFKLFCKHAFKSGKLDDGFAKLTELALECAGGLPLALQVIGSNLYGEDTHFWKSELEKYKRIPEENIYKKLKISYEGLDDLTKKIFLDIACFFKGHKIKYVTKVLNVCGFFADAGIKKLNEKCLITIDFKDGCQYLGMHDLLEDMGKEIVRQESPEEPGKRSRLYFLEDVHEVLEKNKGTEQIEGILIDFPWKDSKIRLDSDVFAKMEKLRILIVKSYNGVRLCGGLNYLSNELKVSFCGGLNSLSNELKVLIWFKCPLKFFPSSFLGEKLIFLHISGGNIRDFGTGLQSKNLTNIDLSYNQYLTNISNLSSCSNLEILIFNGCESLVEVDDSVGFLDKLVQLEFRDCFSLNKLPRSFKLRSLELLELRGCTGLQYFPEIECEMEYLTCVNMSSNYMQELPSSITNLTGLDKLYLEGCKRLVRLPINIFQLQCLKDVNIKDCPNFVNFVEELLPLQPPKSKNLFRKWNFSSVLWTLNPSCIDRFRRSFELDSRVCKEHIRLPPNIEEVDDSEFSSSKNFFPESNNLSRTYNFSSSLRTLNLSGSGIVSLSPCIEGIVGLFAFDLRNCKQLKEILHLPPNIKEVDARGCKLLERFSHVSTKSSFGTPDLKQLTWINLSECNKVEVDVGNHAPDPLLVQERFREKDSSMIIYPESRIPEWFKYCKENTSYSKSIEVEIDHKETWHQIVALVLCFVVGPHPETITISINDQWIRNETSLETSMDPHRVCLQYIAGNSINQMMSRFCWEGSNMRFTFGSDSKGAILKCAVHLI